MSQSSVTASPEWVALQDHYKQAKDWHMRDLFEQDAKRFENFRSAIKMGRDESRCIPISFCTWGQG